jgi:hypothetical protein
MSEKNQEENSNVKSIADYITTKYSKMNEGGRDAQVEMDADGKSSFDAEGKGPMLPDPENADVVRNRKSIEPKGSVVSSEEEGDPDEEETRNEHKLEVLFSGEELSEEFKEKAETIFETVVSERVSAIETSLNEKYETKLQEGTEAILNDLSEKLDDYLNYVVEQWLKENELIIERGIRSDVTENFINNLKNLFEESYIDVPAEKYELLDGLFEQNELLEKELNNLVHNNKELVNEMSTLKKMEVFAEVSDGLASTEVERLASLTESISEGIDAEEFKSKLITIRESYFDSNASTEVTSIQELTEESTDPTIITESTKPSFKMDGYVSTLSRISKANKVS